MKLGTDIHHVTVAEKGFKVREVKSQGHSDQMHLAVNLDVVALRARTTCYKILCNVTR